MTRPRSPVLTCILAASVAVMTQAFLSLGSPALANDGKDARKELITRGKYLLNTSACMDCHTPLKLGDKGPEPDLSRLLSGHPEALRMPPVPALPEGPWLVVSSATNTAWAGPWGVSFTANLTPDPETGLGRWTERDFIATIRTGRHMGRGREILPPMPVPVYNNFTDGDLAAIFAYLQSIPPIRNRVPEPRPPAVKSAQ